ncbi:histamine N-methyltransferase A-like [Antedon mediterranea]|uniref:histamine N-methyltransferase A-like n=1 Tax=Antedon mediterranea TaxID=105859 RepID=UPI003AF94DC1
MDNLTRLSNNPRRYAESFDVYWKLCRNVGAFEHWINSYFPEKIMKEINLERGNKLMALGIGSGPGQTEIKFLKQLLREWPEITDTVVEPDLSYINKYKDLAVKKTELIDGVSFEWRQQTLQQFRQENQNQPVKKYHFIMAIHALYFFEDLPDVLKYLISILEDGGMILAMISCDDSCTSQCYEQMPQFKKNAYAISTRDVEKALEKLQIQYVKHRIQVNMDATSCFDGESKEGELLLDFLTRSAFFKKNASESLYSDMIKHLRSIVLPESKDGKSLLRCDCDAIVITK